METLFEQIEAIVREVCDFDDSVVITADTTFKELELDSVWVYEIAFACMEEFGIDLTWDNVPKTMGEFVSMVDEMINEAQ